MSAQRIRTIGLFGLFGVRNLGNEATLAATVAALRARDPSLRLVLVSAPPAANAGLPEFAGQIDPDLLPVMHRPWRLVPSRWKARWGAFVQWLTEPLRRRMTKHRARELDLLLVAGTGIADDFWQGPFDVPHQIARWCTVVNENGGAVRFASVGAGPVAHPRSRRYFHAALQAADYRSYREHSSKKFAREIGIAADADRVLPDMVFSLPIPPEVATRSVQWPPRRIALGVMGYTGWNVAPEAGEKIYAAYLQKLVWLARALLDSGYAVRLLIGNRGGDRRPVKDLSAALAGHPTLTGGAFVAREIVTHEHVLEEIAETDLVIATRFHNVLKSLLLGRPVISVGYARKNDDLMAEMGLSAYCHAVETFDPAAVLAQVRTIAALPAPPTVVAREKVALYRAELAAQYDRLLQTNTQTGH